MSGENVKITMPERLLNAIAPYPCLGCGVLGTNLCASCVNNIVDDMFFACWGCYEPISDGVCSNHGSKNLSAFWIAGWRESILKEVIDAYKFKSLRRLAPRLAEILDARLPVLPENTVIVPLPTKNKSVRVRGYDHTLLLATALAKIRGLELSSALVATGGGKAQHFSEDKQDREDQVRDTFSINDKIKIDKTRPHLIIDDIVTTGATLLEAHRTLVDEGVSTVWLSALARQPLD